MCQYRWMKKQFSIPCVLWGMVLEQWPLDFVLCQYIIMWPTVWCSVTDTTGYSSAHHHSSDKITLFELAWDSWTAWPGFDFVLSRSDAQIGRPGRGPLLIGLVVCSGVNYGGRSSGSLAQNTGLRSSPGVLVAIASSDSIDPKGSWWFFYFFKHQGVMENF